MKKSLRYISISQITATVTQRSHYQFSNEQISGFVNVIRKEFNDISGLILLATCNRTELYFESVNTSATLIRDFLLTFKGHQSSSLSKKLFYLSDDTETTVNHLLQVSAGLESSVLGDAEIIHQIKKAHQFAIAHHLQGSLLERALQAVFKSHKRISNETHFRDGTTSLAYKSLKIIKDSYERERLKNVNILFVGAGDIVKQLFKYNSKFNFKNIFITNRTAQRAIDLSVEHQCKVYDWDKVLENKLDDFDVIISAVSNYQHLIKNIPDTKQKVVLIDLSVEGNIDKTMAHQEHIKFYDLDTISENLKEAKEQRFSAIDEVNKIIADELSEYCTWLHEAPLRDLLHKYKIAITKEVNLYFEADKEAEKIKDVTNQVMRKLMSKPEVLVSSSKPDTLIAEQISKICIGYFI
jgi:glutamyl-tRNA reductase